MNIMDIKKNLFKNVISDYEFGRPKYPEELYEEIQRFFRHRPHIRNS